MPKVPNVYSMPNGTFRASVSLGFDRVTGKRIQKFKSSMTFQKFLEEYFIPDYKSQVRKRTFDVARSKFKRLSYFYNMSLSSIKPPHIKQWQNAMFNEGLSNNYVRAIHQILQQVFDLAVKLGMLPRNNSRVVGNVKKENPKVDFWTVEEFQQFISTFDKTNVYSLLYFTVFWFFFMTGVRTSELLAIEWQKLDWTTGKVLVDKSIYYKNRKEWYVTDPKSRSSIRNIYLDDDTLFILKQWYTAQSEIGNFRFVFTLSDHPLVKSTLKRILERHSKFAGVKSIRIHDLRHSHASFMLSLGMNDLEMQTRLGHADIKTTLGTYSHLRPTAMKEVAERMTGKIHVSSDNTYNSSFNGNQYRSK